ncbi:hypothetical protein [Marinicellulosiphila megalodicopiae]|uniref:hypothetical protein n=1 Tax=Marinicellulosiphila megalodicopiae TaxID=2724896 RepID=UPI003BB1BD62
MNINSTSIQSAQPITQFSNNLSDFSLKQSITNAADQSPEGVSASATLSITGTLNSYHEPIPISFESFTSSSEATDTTQSLSQALRFSNDSFNSSSNPLLNVTNRFSEFLNNSGESQKEDIRSYSTYTTDGTTNKPDMEGFKDRKTDTLQKMQFSLTTKDGDTITFNIRHYAGDGSNLAYQKDNPDQSLVQAGFSGIEMDFSVNGDLSEQEIEELPKFASNLNQFSNDLLKMGKMDLETLGLSDLSLISKAAINIEGKNAEVKFEFINTDEQRSLSVNFEGNSAKIDIDKTGQLINASTETKQQALLHYLSMMEENGRDADASKLQRDLAADVFSIAMKDNSSTTNEMEVSPDLFKPKHKEQEARAFIALPDFDFEFNSPKAQLNVTEHPEEMAGYDLSLSLNSEQRILNDVVTTTQKQSFELTGGKYDPLPHLEKVDLKYGNYEYTSFDIKSEKVIEISSDKIELLSAVMTESFESDVHKKTYSEKDLIDEEHQKEATADFQDIKQKLAAVENYSNKDIIDLTLLEVGSWEI